MPEVFAGSTIQREGDPGRLWIAALPDLARRLMEQWDLAPDGESMHGYVALVLPVRRGAERCVLKLSWMDDSNAHEATALRRWDGAGAARLLAEDAPAGALLIERLDAHRSLQDEPIGTAGEIAGGLLRRLAVPHGAGIPDLNDVVSEMNETWPEWWRRSGGSVPRGVVDRALGIAGELAPAARRLLIDSDLHYQNVLHADREPWLVIDPKVVIGDPEFAVAQLLWNRFDEILANGGLERQFATVVEAAELDDRRARAWTHVRIIDYWLWALDVGLTEDPVKCAAIADLC